MRKTTTLKTLAAAALTLLAAACAKEPTVVDGNGETTEVSFEVNVPEVAAVTKGISDASTTNELICQVFLQNEEDDTLTPIPELKQSFPIDVATHKATVKFSLVKRNMYTFIFWAQAKDTGYYDTEDLRTIKMKVAKVKANDPEMDAFWAVKTDQRALSTTMSDKVTLVRALAQVNFGTVIPSRADALTIKSSSLKLTGVPDTFHPLLGGKRTACEGNVDITFLDNDALVDEKLNVNNVDYTYVATAYVFALKEDRLLTNASTTVTLSNDKTTTVEAPNAPFKRNNRTNILGNLLMVDAEWNVSIDSRFGDDIEYDAVSANLEAGKNVTLSEDYSVEDAGALVKTADGTMAVLDLNGYNFVNSGNFTDAAKAALQVHGNLTIKGEGTVSCNGGPYASNAIVLENGAHLIIEGGYYFVNKAANGTSNATIYVSDNDYPDKKCLVEIYGGKFEAEVGTDGSPFVLNQADKITESCFVVYGGTFVGFNPADVNENYGNITSFVAPGYKSVETSEGVWEVVDASISVADQTEFETTLSNLSGTEDVIIKLGSGNFEFKKSNYKGNITIKGAGIGKTIVTANTFYQNEGVTISLENLTFDSKNPYVGDAQLCQFLRSDIVLNNCEINGVVGVMSPKSATFTGCTFKNSTNSGFTGYSIIYYGYDESVVTVDNCKFETTGKAICLYGTSGEYNLVVKNCSFSSSLMDKAAIQIHTDYTNGDANSTKMRGNVTVTNTTVSGFNGLWWEGLNNTESKVATTYFTIKVDGTTVQTAE